MRAPGISAVVAFALASPAAAVTRDQQTIPSIHDDASFNAAMLEYRFSLEEFAWNNPYMPAEAGGYAAPVPMEETGAASGEPATAPTNRADDEAQRQLLDHVWSDP
ncbi:MAG TPA: hypothetical protein VFP65_07760 [Anaeromyxobacteraceae bacterium]|nr:hypothetical protein [Anaeromyxobacteraceae bacterium]